MTINIMRRAFLAACVLSGWAVIAGRLTAAEQGLTFFGWSDQHVLPDGNAKHLIPAIDAMNSLPGTDFPKSIGAKCRYRPLSSAAAISPSGRHTPR